VTGVGLGNGRLIPHGLRRDYGPEQASCPFGDGRWGGTLLWALKRLGH